MTTSDEKPPKRSSDATSIRISPTALALWQTLASAEGLNRTAWLEMTLRQIAREKGISIDSAAATQDSGSPLEAR